MRSRLSIPVFTISAVLLAATGGWAQTARPDPRPEVTRATTAIPDLRQGISEPIKVSATQTNLGFGD